MHHVVPTGRLGRLHPPCRAASAVEVSICASCFTRYSPCLMPVDSRDPVRREHVTGILGRPYGNAVSVRYRYTVMTLVSKYSNHSTIQPFKFPFNHTQVGNLGR